MTVASVLTTILISLLGLIGVGIVVCVILYLIQDRLLYMTFVPCQSRYPHNNREELRNPASQGMEYQDLRIRTPDGTQLHGWWIKANLPDKSRTVVFYHENAENLGYRVPFFLQYIRFTQSNIIIFGYRGYSYSEGKPSEKGLKEDALTILKFVTTQLQGIDRSRVFLHGKSLGGAVTIYSASNAQANQIKGVILENTFTSISDIIESIMRKLCLGPFAFVRNIILTSYWRSIDLIDRIRVPILFIKSRKDRLIPTQQMDNLEQKFDLSGGVSRQYQIPEGTHDDTWILDKVSYFKSVNSFFHLCED